MNKGKVYLTGAGPGNEKLITLRGVETIAQADVLVYDRLLSKGLLRYAQKNCELIYVGKSAKEHTISQDEINKIIYEKSTQGKIVTRLKGGDPYVFGRGGEEGEYLADRGIDFEVVPGITSAIGGLAYGGIPITHRDYASSFHVITGHLKSDDENLDWTVLSKLKGTLVFLMGMGQLKEIVLKLIQNGMDGKTPAAIINWAATSMQKSVEGELENIYFKAKEKNIGSPSIIVVGNVVRLKGKLDFFEKKPLFGKKVLVTREKEKNNMLSQKIQDMGGESIEFPVIKIKETRKTKDLIFIIDRLEDYDWLVFTSQNGVKIFFKYLFKAGYDVRKLSGLKVAVIGKATGCELEKYHIKPDLMPNSFMAEDLFEKLKGHIEPSNKILIPGAKNARRYLAQELSKLCEVDELKIYETVKEEAEDYKKEIISKLSSGEIDYVTFTSSSTVNNLIEILGNKKSLLNNTKIVSIGPITTKTAVENGLSLWREAKKYNLDGMIEVMTTERGGKL
jgi:uroporphyrinogen III methyltransferase/synthase